MPTVFKQASPLKNGQIFVWVHANQLHTGFSASSFCHVFSFSYGLMFLFCRRLVTVAHVCSISFCRSCHICPVSFYPGSPHVRLQSLCIHGVQVFFLLCFKLHVHVKQELNAPSMSALSFMVLPSTIKTERKQQILHKTD